MRMFSAQVTDWFERTFEAPSPVQQAAWPAIRSGGHVLASAPTGSGKTLAAFLWSIDRLLEAPGQGTRVLYVSPLKALGNDVEKNLRGPLTEMGASLRVAVRSGDTTPQDRQRLLRRPPDILITTPESLYLLLTSRRSRDILRQVETVIVDEIHALAPNRRGAHLCLSLERLDRLCGRPVQRIGLSATQRPLQRVADLLTGGRPCTLIDVPAPKPPQLEVVTPPSLGAIATQAIWGEVCDHLAAVAEQHRTTLVFTNTRRLAERLARFLGERLGPERVAAHHGSLSRRLRLDAEQRLKAGHLSVLVATASLELGIDIGHVDVVCQVGAPRSLAVLLQRVGRSGHTLHGTSRGFLYPITRDDLVQCAAAVRAVRRRELDETCIASGASDILAQQMVAAAAAEEDGIDEQALLGLCRGAWPYRTLAEEEFYRLVTMLAEGVAPLHGTRGALLHWDRVAGRLRGRRGARMSAVLGGGAIADEGDYEVVTGPEELPVGRLNEDFAVESMVGDVFQLGSSSWRIVRVSQGKVRVEPAGTPVAGIPFWLGEAPGRTPELSRAVAELRETATPELLTAECGVSAEGAQQLIAYLQQGRDALGALPTTTRVVAERFFDESGGMQLIVHAPFGARINRAWGLALRKRFCVSFDFELQAAATDDAVLISLSRKHSFPLADVFRYVHPQSVHKDLVHAVLQSPMFGQRWRWNATRSLALSRTRGGKRLPVPILRMRAEDLLASVFPEQVMCQDNRTGPIEPPAHPLVDATLRDCLEEALDEHGLVEVLSDLLAGRIETVAVDSIQPSPFSHEILHASPYAYLDDAPLEERRARAVYTGGAIAAGDLARGRPPGDWTPTRHERGVDDTGAAGSATFPVASLNRRGHVPPICQVDPEAVRNASRWPEVRSAEELHDLLLRVGWLSGESTGQYRTWLPPLLAAGRAVEVSIGGRVAWAAFERQDWVHPGDAEAQRICLAWLEFCGPVTVAGLSRFCLLPLDTVYQALLALEARGLVMQGHYTPEASSIEWCHRDLLARMHRETLRRLRASVEPVSQDRYQTFLDAWQHRSPQLEGEEGLLQVLEQVQGTFHPLSTWETLPVQGDVPELLERLCLSGEVGWACRSESQVALFLRDAARFILPDATPVSPLAERVRERLERGAAFAADLARELNLSPTAVRDALWELALSGQAATDSLRPLHAYLGRVVRRGESRWFAWAAGPVDSDERLLWQVRQLLRRWGVLHRDLLGDQDPAWRGVRPVLSRLEARGEVRMGYFVQGAVPEQYALPEAVAALRETQPFSGHLRMSRSSGPHAWGAAP